MAKCRCYYQPDGKVSIVHVAPKASRDAGETDDQWFNRHADKVAAGAGLTGLDYDEMDTSQLPQDLNGKKKDREAWRGSKGNGISVDRTVKNQIEYDSRIEEECDRVEKQLIMDQAISNLKAKSVDQGGIPNNHEYRKGREKLPGRNSGRIIN